MSAGEDPQLRFWGQSPQSDLEIGSKGDMGQTSHAPPKISPHTLKLQLKIMSPPVHIGNKKVRWDDELWRLLDQPLLLDESFNQMVNITISKLSSDISPQTLEWEELIQGFAEK